jgi:hypothetical protein
LQIDYEAEMGGIQAEVKVFLEQEKKSQTMLEASFKGIGFDVT